MARKRGLPPALKKYQFKKGGGRKGSAKKGKKK
jgi:hypothetical protein